MTERNRRSLDVSKSSDNPNFAIYQKELDNAFEIYNLKESSVSSGIKEVKEGAIRLLTKYDVDPEIMSDVERNLIILAISDSWLGSDSLDEKKALLDSFKLAVIGQTDAIWETSSKRVKILSEKGYKQGRDFDPDLLREQHMDEIFRIESYVNDNIDEERSLEMANQVEKWEGSQFESVRNKLGITKDEEIGFEIYILKKSGSEMTEEIGAPILTIKTEDSNKIIASADFWQSELEHDYVHTQVKGLVYGYKGVFFRGVDEAETETYASHYEHYYWQINFLQEVVKRKEGLRELVNRAFREGGPYRKELMTEITSLVGLRNFLIFARMSPIEGNMEVNDYEKRFYIDPIDALDKIRAV